MPEQDDLNQPTSQPVGHMAIGPGAQVIVGMESVLVQSVVWTQYLAQLRKLGVILNQNLSLRKIASSHVKG